MKQSSEESTLPSAERDGQIAEIVDIEEERQPSSSVPEVIDIGAEPDSPAHLAADPRSPATIPQLVVPIVVGTRPEAIKLVPIILALRESEFYKPVVVSTGQHHRMVQEIFDLAGIRTDVTLWAGGRRELNERVTSVMSRFEDFFVEWFGIPTSEPNLEAMLAGKAPACVLVHGDTSSAMASALAAFHLRVPVMHVEAGLRTGGLNLTPFPEELNRQLISYTMAASMATSRVGTTVPVPSGGRMVSASPLPASSSAIEARNVAEKTSVNT